MGKQLKPLKFNCGISYLHYGVLENFLSIPLLAWNFRDSSDEYETCISSLENSRKG